MVAYETIYDYLHAFPDPRRHIHIGHYCARVANPCPGSPLVLLFRISD